MLHKTWPPRGRSRQKGRRKSTRHLIASGESAGDAIYALTDAMSKVKVTNILNCDGKTIATVTAPFMAPAIEKINTRQLRKVGKRR